MNKGFIQLHRSLLEWEWYDDNNTKILFLHCLLKANYKDKNYRGKTIKRGSFVTGRDILANELSLSVQQVRTSLTKLKSTNEITIKPSSQGTVIEVVKYNDYQEVTNKATDEQPTNNQQVTTTNKSNNIKKSNNIFIPPQLHEVSQYCIDRKNSVDASKFIDFYECKGWMVGKNKMKCWKSAVRTWEKSSSSNQQSQQTSGYQSSQLL